MDGTLAGSECAEGPGAADDDWLVDQPRCLQALVELNSTEAIDEPSIQLQVALAATCKVLDITSRRHREAIGLVLKAIASMGGGRKVLDTPSGAVLAVAKVMLNGKLPRKWKFARRARHVHELLGKRDLLADRSRSIGRLMVEVALDA